jgi:hypothetical protein
MGRIRHGLLIQEMLDKLAGAGLVFYPYYIILEPVRAEALTLDPHTTVRALVPGDAAEMLRIQVRRQSEEVIAGRLSRAACLGIFHDGELAGYTWADRQSFPIPATNGQVLFALAPHEAYLFGTFVAPRHRGRRLAGMVRAHMQMELGRQGCTHCYSTTLAFNRSSMRFKTWLGLGIAERRLYLHLRIGSLPGIDLRLWRRDPRVASPRWKRVARTRARSDD